MATQRRERGGTAEEVQKSEGVFFIGNAQGKRPVFRTERHHNEATARSYRWLVRSVIRGD